MHLLKPFTNFLSKFFFGGILFINLISCDSQKSTEATDSLSTNNEIESNNEAPSSSISPINLVDLILFSNKTDRTNSIGKSLEEVFASEIGEVSDSASNFKSFTQYFNNSNDEFVDIQYFNDGKVVTGLNLDIYLNNQADVSLLFGQFVLAFNDKYGKPAKQKAESTWKLKNNMELKLKDVSQKLAPGLQITFSKKGESLVTQ
ncbi:MAG: hypothetical protein V4683_10330 [Bacteroidota bacterium]